MKRFNRLSLRTLALLFVALLSQLALAQTRTVNGVVTDSNGEPLVGVTIAVKGSTNYGVITDLDGRYTISVPQDKTTLVFSYVDSSSSRCR